MADIIFWLVDMFSYCAEASLSRLPAPLLGRGVIVSIGILLYLLFLLFLSLLFVYAVCSLELKLPVPVLKAPADSTS